MRRILDVNISRIGRSRKEKERLRMVRAGGGVKHRLMTDRLKRRPALEVPAIDESETRVCPTCSMHVTLAEATWCLACPPFPITEEPITTTGAPHWWGSNG